ncbi:DMT family transporter [Paenibacillus sp. WLX2291]|uniref:DMT family transporter n=1 Tax=Paenibacillus sp. WLX2291 TaxID=3296934 RepID=UPI0039842912
MSIVLIIIVTLIGGAAVSTQSSINGTASKRIGLLETVFISLSIGALVLTILVCFFGSGKLFDLIHAPKTQLLAVFLGFGYLFLSSFNVNTLGVTPANLATIVGQILAGFVIDTFGLFDSAMITFSWQRVVAIVFMLGALTLIFSEKQNTPTTQILKKSNLS